MGTLNPDSLVGRGKKLAIEQDMEDIAVKLNPTFPKGQGSITEEYRPEIDSEDKVLLDSKASGSSDSGSQLLTEEQPDINSNVEQVSSKVEPLSKKTVARQSGYLKDILGD